MKNSFIRSKSIIRNSLLSAAAFATLLAGVGNAQEPDQGEWMRRLLEEAMRNGGRLELELDDFGDLLENFDPQGKGNGGGGFGGIGQMMEQLFEQFEQGGAFPFGLNPENLPGFDLNTLPKEETEKLDAQYNDLMAAHRPIIAGARKSTVGFWRGKRPLVHGVVVHSDGWALSKASELAKADGMLRCELPDGRKVGAKVARTFDEHDLALVRIDAEELEAVTWSAGGAPKLGSFLTAVGTSEDPLAVGVVSVESRNLDRGFLGVALKQIDNGVMIDRVNDDTAAARAGIRHGDVIRSINGHDFSKVNDVIRRVQRFRSGEQVEIVIERNGREKKLNVDLGRRPDLTAANPRARMMQKMGGRLSERRGNYPNALQTDLPLQPEECGGPVVDLDGNVIGLSIARAGRIKTFAIPSSEIIQLLSTLDWNALQDKVESDADATNDTQRELDRALRELEETKARLREAEKASEKVRRALEEDR